MDRFTCNSCGFSVDERDLDMLKMSCPNCGNNLQLDGAAEDEANDDTYHPSLVQSEKNYYQPEFTGTAGEYFRIWIVNTLLTIMTLGIYGAWAKVRTRQFFYKHTLIDGTPLDYKANPLSILKGNLIIGAGILLYYVAEAYNPIYTIAVATLFYIAIPFFIYKSLRFFAHNSAFRNIRFRFLGSLKESYKTYLLFPLFIPFTLGLIIPYWAFMKKNSFTKAIAYSPIPPLLVVGLAPMSSTKLAAIERSKKQASQLSFSFKKEQISTCLLGRRPLGHFLPTVP